MGRKGKGRGKDRRDREGEGREERSREERSREEPGADRGRRSGKRDGDGEEESRGGAAELLRTLVVAGILFIVIRVFLVGTFVITSGSMEETLLVGDFLMVNRLALGSRIPGTRARLPGYSEPRRGDVIVFDPPHEDDLKLVKRLVGLPGDTLSMRGGVLHVDGEPLEEPYVRHRDLPDEPSPWMAWQREYLAEGVDPGTYAPTRDEWGPIVIPEGHYFMLGDNREASLDSRYWGLLERWRLEGRAGLIYFSYDRDALAPFPIFTEVRWGRIGDRVD